MSQPCPLCIDRYGLLTREIATPIGIYPAGSLIVVLEDGASGTTRICLDRYGQHLGGRCHAVTVPGGWVDSPDPARRRRNTSKVSITGPS